jgi:hypothetical protein
MDLWETRSRMPQKAPETTEETPKAETPETKVEAPKGVPASVFSDTMGEVLSLTPPKTRTRKATATTKK